jgi:hypothetical protein
MWHAHAFSFFLLFLSRNLICCTIVSVVQEYSSRRKIPCKRRKIWRLKLDQQTAFNVCPSDTEQSRASGEKSGTSVSDVLQRILTFCNMLVFYGAKLLAPAQLPTWRTLPCRLSMTAYAIYSQLPSISGGLLLHPQTEDAPCNGDKGPT